MKPSCLDRLFYKSPFKSNRSSFIDESCCFNGVCEYFALFPAGLPDMAMSALVKEQIEGIKSEAISMIPPDKFTVSCFTLLRQCSCHSFNRLVWTCVNPLCLLSPLVEGGVWPETDQHVLLWAGSSGDWGAVVGSVWCSKDSSGYGADTVGGQACGL